MVSRDYTQEVGLPSGQKTVSKPVAAVCLLAMALGAFFAVKTLVATHHPVEARPPAAVAQH